MTTVAVDGVNKEEVLEDGIGRIVGRTQLELPLFYEDFTLLSRDMEYAAQTGYPLDLSVAIAAAKKASRREDDLILNGSKALAPTAAHGEGIVKNQEERLVAGRKQLRRYHRRVAQLAKTGYLAATRSWCRPTCSSTCSACSRTPVCWRSTASRSSSATTCT